MILGNLKILETDSFKIVGKDVCRQNLKSRFMNSQNLEYEINIFQKTRNGNLIIPDAIEET